MPAFLVDIIVIFLLLLCNGVLAMTEMAIVSARKARLVHWAEEGDKAAQLALEIHSAPQAFLSAIQIGITLVALTTGIYGGATLADDLSAQIQRTGHTAGVADAIAMGIVAAALTYVSVVIGELVPKRIALSAPEMISKYVSRPLKLFALLTTPLVWLLTSSTETVVRAFGLKPHQDQHVTEAEIQVLVDQATEAGVFEEVEQEMVESVLRLDERRVGSLMTPRRAIEWIDTADPEELWLETAFEVPHSRLLVAEGSLDKVVGVIQTKELIRQKLDKGKVDLHTLQDLLTQPMYVPESMSALDLLQRFRNNSQEMALVLDEYGGVHGLVSREDVFEAIVGDLPMDRNEPKVEITKRDDGSWFCDGQLEIADFKEALHIDEQLPGEGEEDYLTVAGFILYQFERVPSEGDYFIWNGFRFEVVDMDRHRIDKLLITKA